MSADTRVAIITGCAMSNGIGAATARVLSANGIAVAVTDIVVTGVSAWKGDISDTEWRGVDSLVDEIETAGGTAIALTGDISAEVDVGRIVDATLERFGRIDILVNNAAAPRGADRSDIAAVPVESWDRLFAVNCRGAFLMCKAVVETMRARQYGRIVNVSSEAANVGHVNRTAYSASKAALLGFTKALAVDLGPWQINVNAVCPGLTLTSRGIKIADGQANDPGAENVRNRIPLRRFATPEDMAAIISFLASESCGYLTGQYIRVNGGADDPGFDPIPAPTDLSVSHVGFDPQ